MERDRGGTSVTNHPGPFHACEDRQQAACRWAIHFADETPMARGVHEGGPVHGMLRFLLLYVLVVVLVLLAWSGIIHW